MTCHAGIHPTIPPLIQSIERIGLMTHALGAVRYRPHEACVAGFFVNGRAVEPGLMDGGSTFRCRSLYASLAILF